MTMKRLRSRFDPDDEDNLLFTRTEIDRIVEEEKKTKRQRSVSSRYSSYYNNNGSCYYSGILNNNQKGRLLEYYYKDRALLPSPTNDEGCSSTTTGMRDLFPSDNDDDDDDQVMEDCRTQIEDILDYEIGIGTSYEVGYWTVQLETVLGLTSRDDLMSLTEDDMNDIDMDYDVRQRIQRWQERALDEEDVEEKPDPNIFSFDFDADSATMIDADSATIIDADSATTTMIDTDDSGFTEEDFVLF
jgi:hypothetical protein